MKSVRTKSIKRKATRTMSAGLVRGKRSRTASTKAVPPTIDEARAVLKQAEAAYTEGVFAVERRKRAEYLGAARVLFSKDRGVAEMLTHALTGSWGGPDHLLEAGYMQLSRELDVALTALGRIAVTDDFQKDAFFDVQTALRGIQKRLEAMPSVARMFKDAAEQAGAS